MKNYYDVLDIPTTATFDEIKAQYRRLVRIYHPDRFINPLDKVYAEHKLKELNEAYAVLSANTKTADTTEAYQPLPIPIVEPTVLEFGTVAVGQRHSVKFKVGNAGGPTKNISFVYSDEHAWYSIAKVRQVFPDKPFPVEIEVIVNSNKLAPSENYQSWFDVNMDGATSRVELRLQTTYQAPAFRLFPHRLALVTATCLLMIILTLIIPWARSLNVAFGLPAAPALFPAHLFDESKGGVSTPLAQSAPESLEWAPVFSPDRRQVAFISNQLGSSQIFIRDPHSGRLRQVTHSSAEKSLLIWSPDGSQLAFVARDGTKTTVQVFTVNEEETLIFVPDLADHQIRRLAWAADSQALLFDSVGQNGQQFYQANLISQDIEPIPAPVSWP